MKPSAMEMLKQIYDWELNILISSFWDAGYALSLGDHVNGIIESSAYYHELDEGISWLYEKACKHVARAAE
jgi:hypothetical protein